MARDDPILTLIKYISMFKDVQKYGAILSDTLMNQEMKESDAYKTYYAFAFGKEIPKPKYVRPSTKEKTIQAPKTSPGQKLKTSAKVAKSGKKKLPETVPTAKGLKTLSEMALCKAKQMKVVTKKRKTDYHVSHTSGLDDDEVSESKDDEDNSDDEDDDQDDQDDDSEQNESKNDGDDFVHPKFSTHDKEEGQDEEDKEEECFNQRIHTASYYESTDDEAYNEVTQSVNVEEEKLDKEKTNEEGEVNEMYNDSSSVSSSFISKMLNPNPDTCIDSTFNLNIESTSLVDVTVTTNDEIHPSYITTLLPPPIPLIQPLQQTPVSTTTIVLSISIPDLPSYILATYGDAVTFKRRRDNEDGDEEPSAGSNRGSKRSKARKEPESTSAPKHKTSKSTSSSKEGFKSKTRSTGKSDQAEEQVYTIKYLEEPAHQEFETGQQYPHDLCKPLPLIPNSRGRQVIPFDYFINNDLAYLSGGVSSRTYATLVTTTKAEDYGHIKWIEHLVPNTMWNPVNSELMIVKWHNYKHLDWITVHRDEDKLYTFKEGDYKILRLQDIEDMLLLLVEGKLKNLTIEERLALGVSLRMFTRSIVIKRHVEDLQLDIKNKMNRLMCIDELYKFSNGTLNDVRSALDDILKRIQMEYLPQTVRRDVDRQRAGAMIQAIDQQLRNRRIMRSLEKFVGGRPYMGDLRLLERTI
nr:hypothetical protein [Tanacetum cinerariifolium]